MTLIPLMEIPRTPVGEWIEGFFDWLTTNLSAFFDAISGVMDAIVVGLTDLLVAPNAIIMVLIFSIIGALIRSWKFGFGALLALLLVVSIEQWEYAMETLALVGVATLVAVIIAVPLGILAARRPWASAILKPIMDLMQTMPAFVWLVPVVMLFGIGVVPGVVATIIFALPPGVRFTELGIRNVDEEIVEAANAFGATPRQTLFGVQLPLAMPTIMAGINQVIMLALSMAVIAGLVGAGGLGGQVTAAIATLNLGLGFEAGLGVVILAIYLDRVTAALGQGGNGVLGEFMKRRRAGTPPAPAGTPASAVDDSAATADVPN